MPELFNKLRDLFGHISKTQPQFCKACINYLEREVDVIMKRESKNRGTKSRPTTKTVPLPAASPSDITIDSLTSTVETITRAASENLLATLNQRLNKFEANVGDRIKAMETSIVQMETRMKVNQESTIYLFTSIFSSSFTHN